MMRENRDEIIVHRGHIQHQEESEEQDAQETESEANKTERRTQ